MYNPSDEFGLSMIFADDIRNEFGHSMIGTGHILYGILIAIEPLKGERSTVTYQALKESTDVGALKRDLEERLALSAFLSRSNGLWTVSSESAAKKAIEEAMNMNHRHIGTEHLILGLFESGKETVYDIAQEILERYANILIYRRNLAALLGVEKTHSI